jgi:hypothetical protein
MSTDKRPRSRAALVDLYYRWVEANTYQYACVFAVLSIATTLILVVFDLIVFADNAAFFRPYRAAAFVVSGGVLATLRLRRAKLQGCSSLELKALMIAPALFYNCMSHSFLVTATFQREVIAQGNVFSLALTTFFVYRFWGIQYFMQAVSAAVLTGIAVGFPEARAQACTLLLADGLIFMAILFLRREFAQAIFDRFQSLASMLPTKLAEFIALAHDSTDMNEVFGPRRMHTICIVSDWRNYQSLIKSRGPEDISRLFEVYYESVLAEIDARAPNRNYYASWTADELFVVFYSDEDTVEENFAQAAAFVMEFATGLSGRLREALGFDLLYDIGIAAGPGLLGLQGPNRMKKTTVVSQVAGEAKRLETEAKMYRHRSATTNRYPVIAMDSTVGSYLMMKNCIAPDALQEVKATAKDLDQAMIYVWQHDDGSGAAAAPAAGDERGRDRKSIAA